MIDNYDNNIQMKQQENNIKQLSGNREIELNKQVEINLENNQNYQNYADLREQKLRARENIPRDM